MAIRKYSDSDIKKFKKLYSVTNSHKLAGIFNITSLSVNSLASRLKLHKSQKYRSVPVTSIWTDKKDRYLKKHYANTPNPDLAKLFNTTVSAIKNRSIFLCLKKSKKYMSGGFKKGNVSWNKGKKGYMGANKTSFKKGNLPHNTKHDGAISTRCDKSGFAYMYIRISQSKWVMLHVYNWAKKHGKVPTGKVVVFKTNDRTNCKPSNLELITRKELVKRNANREKMSQTMKRLYSEGKINNPMVNLSDSFVLQTIAFKDKKMQEFIRKTNPQLIELKRAQLQLNREIKKHGST